MRKLAVCLLLSSGFCGIAVLNGAIVEKGAPGTSSQPTVLITANPEIDNSTSVNGAATQAAGVTFGSGSVNSSTYEHSEVWEAVRRFDSECPEAIFVTNPQTPHRFTIHVDYQKADAGFLGSIAVYQLTLLDSGNNPLYVSKKNYLRREIKPICKVIAQQK